MLKPISILLSCSSRSDVTCCFYAFQYGLHFVRYWWGLTTSLILCVGWTHFCLLYKLWQIPYLHPHPLQSPLFMLSFKGSSPPPPTPIPRTNSRGIWEAAWKRGNCQSFHSQWKHVQQIQRIQLIVYRENIRYFTLPWCVLSVGAAISWLDSLSSSRRHSTICNLIC